MSDYVDDAIFAEVRAELTEIRAALNEFAREQDGDHHGQGCEHCWEIFHDAKDRLSDLVELIE